MGSPLRRAILFLSLAAIPAPALEARGQVYTAQKITISFSFPDGSTKSTSVNAAEVEQLTGQRPAYMLLPWVVAALRKLDLPHSTEADAKGVRITSIAGVTNDPRYEWRYSANGVPSPYRLSTQTIEGVNRVALSYTDRIP